LERKRVREVTRVEEERGEVAEGGELKADEKE